MAKFVANTSESIIKIGKFLGVNENPDGDTKLKMGEAAEMRNWRVTKDNHLQIRPGYSSIVTLGTTSILDLWHGFVNGTEMTLAVCNGKLYSVNISAKTSSEIGSVTGSHAHIFGFDKKAYILTGSKYYVYDGTTLSEVAGYRPLIATEVPPAGGGTTREQTNKLNGQRRVWFSPNGTATTFQLPETGLASIDYVTKRSDGSAISFTANTSTGVATTSAAPANGTDTIEIGYTVSTTYRSQVEAMRFCETYNGETDTRLFLYGDGSNKAFYSGLDYDGTPRADYFPDQNEIAVDSSNTPITAMIKHYDRLLTFKTDGSFITTYGTITDALGNTLASFYTSPLNRAIGHVAPGQAVLVKNNPFTLFGRSVYEWQLSSYAAKDERNAKNRSDRVRETLGSMTLSSAICFDDEFNTEYYICQNGTCVVYNYTADAWYIYTNIYATCFSSMGGELYFGTSDGKIEKLSRDYRNDNGTAIDARWESAAMDFGADFKRKNSSELWVSLKPESQGRVTVTIQSNLKSDYDEKVVACSLATFSHASFEHWSFNTNRKPQTTRIKLKAKKFTYYKLIFTSASSSATATILSTDIRVRYAGNVK